MGLMVMEGMSVEISQSLYPSLKSVVCQARFGNVGFPGFQDLETLVMTLSQVLNANLCHMGWIHNVIITSSWGSELRDTQPLGCSATRSAIYEFSSNFSSTPRSMQIAEPQPGLYAKRRGDTRCLSKHLCI